MSNYTYGFREMGQCVSGISLVSGICLRCDADAAVTEGEEP